MYFSFFVFVCAAVIKNNNNNNNNSDAVGAAVFEGPRRQDRAACEQSAPLQKDRAMPQYAIARRATKSVIVNTKIENGLTD